MKLLQEKIQLFETLETRHTLQIISEKNIFSKLKLI